MNHSNNGPKRNLGKRAAFGIALTCLGVFSWLGYRNIQRRRQLVLYDVCTARLNQHSGLKQAIGLPITFDDDSLVAPNMEEQLVNEKAALEFEIRGSTGHATVRAWLLYKNGEWIVKRFEADCHDGTYVEDPETGLL